MITWLLMPLFHGTNQEYLYNTNPLPMAEVLDQVLTKFMNKSDYTGSLFSFLTGDEDFGDPDNLDVSILNANNVFKIISKTKKRYEPYFRRTKSESINRNPKLVATAMDLMRQSIYATRYRMQETKRFRRTYSSDARFQLAVCYGALMQVTQKMETLFSIMRKLQPKTYLLWYVILYEKLLAAHVDVHNLVDRIFILHEKQIDINEGKKRVVLAPTLRPRVTVSRIASRGTGRRFTTRAAMNELANMTYDDITQLTSPSTTRVTVVPAVG
ncbi:hypothetical protein evm_007991 [Chilo suppressalis]|nr:hypothetical protein evm_007991 [Chilo suppressalis]